MPETNYAKKLPTLPSYILDLVTSKPSELPPWGIFTDHQDDSARGSGPYPGKAEPYILRILRPDNSRLPSGDSFGLTESGSSTLAPFSKVAFRACAKVASPRNYLVGGSLRGCGRGRL